MKEFDVYFHTNPVIPKANRRSIYAESLEAAREAVDRLIRENRNNLNAVGFVLVSVSEARTRETFTEFLSKL